MLLVLLFYISLDKVAGVLHYSYRPSRSSSILSSGVSSATTSCSIRQPTGSTRWPSGSLAGFYNSSAMASSKVTLYSHSERKPALLDNILQVFSAPMFVIVEVLFMVGWRQQLHQECSAAISQNIREFREHAKK